MRVGKCFRRGRWVEAVLDAKLCEVSSFAEARLSKGVNVVETRDALVVGMLKDGGSRVSATAIFLSFSFRNSANVCGCE